MRCERPGTFTRGRPTWWRLLVAGTFAAACGGEVASGIGPAGTNEVSGRWLLRSTESLNECAALGSFRPFDLHPVELREDGGALSVEQGPGDRIVYASSDAGGWTRSAQGAWDGCLVVGTASLHLRRLASSQLAGRYEATYTTDGGAACEAFPSRCSVVHDLTGVRP